MKIICAWCHCVIHEEPDNNQTKSEKGLCASCLMKCQAFAQFFKSEILEEPILSHGICPTCYEKSMTEIEHYVPTPVEKETMKIW